LVSKLLVGRKGKVRSMSNETDELALWKGVDELLANIQDNNSKLSKFTRLFQERADENAIKIWVQCFKEAYSNDQQKQQEEQGITL
jgi:hypothetical protein